MRLTTHFLLVVRRRLREQDGLVMLYALAATLVVLASSAAAFAAINNDLPLSSADAAEKQAYAAAQAGIQRYLYELNENSEYWTQCGAGTNWVFNTDQTPVPQQVPGSSTETYAVTLLPAAGQSTYTKCDTSNAVSSMVQQTGPGAGSIRISSTGWSGGLKRTIVAALREQSFLDYAWFTNYETADPLQEVAEDSQSDPTLEAPSQCASDSSPPANCGSNYAAALTGAQKQCSQYRFGGFSRGGDNKAGYGAGVYFSDTNAQGHKVNYSCQDIEFVTGDGIKGPFHSNDSVLVCGTPTFGSAAGDSVEFGGPSPGWVGAGCGGDQPIIDGNPSGTATQSSNIQIPAVNSLQSIAGLNYYGTTCLTLDPPGAPGKIQVSQPNATYPSCFSQGIPTSLVNYPSNGVLYVHDSQAGCSVVYDVDAPSYTGNTGCGTVYVSGADSTPLTIGADQDIVIDGNLTYANSTAMLGLVATNFVRVYHPMGAQPLGTNSGSCSNYSNAAGSMVNPTIDAMILSLDHSFIVDQYDCGAKLGTLTINGGVAQDFRGTVGTGAGGGAGTGYLKNYNYDPRLRYEEPPHFLTPVEGAWKVARETECQQTVSCSSTTLS